MMKKEMKTKISILSLICLVIVCFINQKNKHDNIYKKLDMIMSNQEMIWLNTNELKIDSLQQEIMDIGWKYDSLTLKYEHGWEF